MTTRAGLSSAALLHFQREGELMKTLAIFLVLNLLPTITAAQQLGIGDAQLSIPGVTGVLELNVGWTMWESSVTPGGKETQLRATERADHLVISAFLQRVDFAASAEKCRSEWWARSEKGWKKRGLNIEEVQLTERAGMAVVTFFLAEFQDKPVRHRSLHAYLGSRDLCAEIHMSKEPFEKQDEKLFEEVLATVKLLPDQVAKAPSREQRTRILQIEQASGAYVQHDYATAAKLFQRILNEEKQKPVMSKTLFRRMIVYLRSSYALMGDMAKAKETLEYGVTQQPDYPLFYYNLACMYGELGKMDDALAQLRLAYKNKANMTPGETFPDPLKDDSFRNFVKDKKFLDAVRAMQ